jgi:hypothetical protein
MTVSELRVPESSTDKGQFIKAMGGRNTGSEEELNLEGDYTIALTVLFHSYRLYQYCHEDGPHRHADILVVGNPGPWGAHLKPCHFQSLRLLFFLEAVFLPHS